MRCTDFSLVRHRTQQANAWTPNMVSRQGQEVLEPEPTPEPDTHGHVRTCAGTYGQVLARHKRGRATLGRVPEVRWQLESSGTAELRLRGHGLGARRETTERVPARFTFRTLRRILGIETGGNSGEAGDSAEIGNPERVLLSRTVPEGTVRSRTIPSVYVGATPLD